MTCADCAVNLQSEPATEQVKPNIPKELIVRPAVSALPKILCNTAILATTQQQPQTCLQSGTSSHGAAGSRYKAAAEPVQKLSRQHSTSTLPSAEDSAPRKQVKREPSQECRTGPAQQQALAPASGIQSKQQASFNTVTSGEYSHLTIKQQLSVKTALPAPLTQQPEAPAVNHAPHQLQPYSIFPAGEDDFSAPALNRGSSHSFDSCYLPIGDMPDLDFEAGNDEIPQGGFWEAGQDAQMPQTQMGARVDPASHGEAGSLAGQSKPWDWCNFIQAQSLEHPPPCLPDLTPLSELPPSWCTSLEQQAWQSGWQQQQHGPQDLHPHDQRQQFQHTPFVGIDHDACPNVANMECMEPVGPSSSAEAAWLTLPTSCSIKNVPQADPAFAAG